MIGQHSLLPESPLIVDIRMTHEPLQHHLVSLHAHQLPSGHGLHDGEDLGQTRVPHVLQLTQQTRLEEHLGEIETPGQRSTIGR